MPFSFTTKVNQRPIGQEVLINNEQHLVPAMAPFSIKLIEVPRQNVPSSVSIPGFTETFSTPSPGQFQVNYPTGYITFNATAALATVFVTYYGKGSIVDAVDVDTIQAAVTTLSTNFDGSGNLINFAAHAILVGEGTSPVITLPTGSSSQVLISGGPSANPTWVNQNTISAGNFTGSLSGDVTGTQSATVVARINGVALGTTTATSGNILVGDGTDWDSVALSGDATLTSTGVLTLDTVNSNVGSFGTASNVGSFTVNGKGLITAASNTAIAIDASAIISGILNVTRGGTGVSNPTAHGLLVGEGSSSVNTVGPSSVTYSALLSQGLGNDPTFLPINAGNNVTITSGTGGLTINSTGNVSQINAGTGISVSSSTGNVTVSLITPVSVSNGGTGDTTLTSHAVLIGEGTSPIAFAAPTSTANALVSNGTGSDPSFQTLPIAGGGTNNTSFTQGSVIFAGSGGTILTQDNSNLFWDNTNKFLSIGTNTSFGGDTILTVNQPNNQFNGICLTGASANMPTNILLAEGSTTRAFIAYLNSGYSGGPLKLEFGTATGPILFFTGNTERMRLLDTSGNLGIGTTTPTSLFSVGSSSQFQVNSSGNIVTLNNVTTSFPSSQGAANTFLENDGSGNLTWNLVSLTASVSGILPIANGGTNSSSFTAGSIIFAGSGGTSLTQDNSNLFYNDSTNRFGIGTNSPSGTLHINTHTSPVDLWFSSDDPSFPTTSTARIRAGNGISDVQAATGTQRFSIVNNAAGARLLNVTNSGNVGINSNSDPINILDVKGGIAVGTYAFTNTAPSNGAIISGNVGIGTSSPSSLLSVGSSSQFQVDSNGNLIKLNNVTQSWPSSQGAASTVLTNDGSGNLTWNLVSLTASVTGTLPVGNGGTGTSTTFTAGSVIFAGSSGIYSQDNSNFFWDSTNHRLGLGTNTPDTSSILDVVSTTKGSRPTPSMTEAQRDAISSPATGLEIFNTDQEQKDFYNGTFWASQGGYWIKQTLSYSAFTTTANTDTVTLFMLPPAGHLEEVILHHTTSFSGGTTITAYTISVGNITDNARYASAFDVFQAPGGSILEDAVTGYLENFNSATTITATGISTGDTLNHATQGSVDIFVRYSVIK